MSSKPIGQSPKDEPGRPCSSTTLVQMYLAVSLYGGVTLKFWNTICGQGAAGLQLRETTDMFMSPSQDAVRSKVQHVRDVRSAPVEVPCQFSQVISLNCNVDGASRLHTCERGRCQCQRLGPVDLDQHVRVAVVRLVQLGWQIDPI